MDFVSDQNPLPLYLADEKVGFPDYVKEANQLQAEDLTDISSGAFADFANREFPIHTKEATWLSAAYWFADGRSNGKVENALSRAASAHGITEDYEKLASMGVSVKAAAAISDLEFALSMDFGGIAGKGVENFYPLNGPEDVIESSRIMLKDADARRLPIEAFREAATNLVKAASIHSVSHDLLHSRVVALGTARLPDFEHAVKIAEARGWAGVPAHGVELFVELAKSAAENPEQLDDYIGLWLDMDAAHQVKYSSTVLDPYQAFYAGETEDSVRKMASEVVIINTAMVPKSVFSTLSEDSVRKAFSKAAADKVVDLQKKACANPAAVSLEIASFEEVERRTLLQVLLTA